MSLTAKNYEQMGPDEYVDKEVMVNGTLHKIERAAYDNNNEIRFVSNKGIEFAFGDIQQTPAAAPVAAGGAGAPPAPPRLSERAVALSQMSYDAYMAAEPTVSSVGSKNYSRAYREWEGARIASPHLTAERDRRMKAKHEALYKKSTVGGRRSKKASRRSKKASRRSKKARRTKRNRSA
jgi:hypothetical protein